MGRGRDSRVVVVHGAKTSGEVTGLRLYSRYELSVTAFNSKGEGPHSPQHNFSTPEGGECQCKLWVSSTLIKTRHEQTKLLNLGGLPY